MLTIDNVTKRYGDFVAVNGLSMSIEPGTIFGFLGPKVRQDNNDEDVCGLIRLTEGSMRMDKTSTILLKRRVSSVTYRTVHVYERLTAKEYMYFCWPTIFNAVTDLGTELLSLFGLGHVQDHLVESFSRGMKQRLVMASVLLHRPKLMVVDEPMVRLDPQGPNFKRHPTQGSEREWVTSLSTHTLDVADEVRDCVAVNNRGTPIAQGSLRRDKQAPGRRPRSLSHAHEEGPSNAPVDA